MKNLLKIIGVAALAFTMASCGAVNDPYGNNYPTNYPNNGTVYRAGDGTVYRQGEVYRDRNGNVYQNGRIIRTGDVYGQPGILSRSGNYPVYGNNPQNLPPGQAKKVYGGKAKDYAPGQVKKRQNGYYGNDGRWYKYEDDDKHGNKKYKAKKNKKHKDRWDD